MVTFILDSESANEPVRSLLDRLSNDGLRICDANGREIAILRPSAADEDTLYADAIAAALDDRAELDRRASRRDGLTTEELRHSIGMPAAERS